MKTSAATLPKASSLINLGASLMQRMVFASGDRILRLKRSLIIEKLSKKLVYFAMLKSEKSMIQI